MLLAVAAPALATFLWWLRFAAVRCGSFRFGILSFLLVPLDGLAVIFLPTVLYTACSSALVSQAGLRVWWW